MVGSLDFFGPSQVFKLKIPCLGSAADLLSFHQAGGQKGHVAWRHPESTGGSATFFNFESNVNKPA